ncbi:DNA adenine methylase [Pseudoroseicyclus aestuarii]|uniref:site-specific DNA-methyltransferase (adenine-specific) n=1 Tax=Pseudoroseicyclus aestuarii TaxID=1795041 RepID=A0A318SRD2_9RHOB|nr:DNA adenine methylase [Pseudoroseicyclus aestuarii]PYE80802.1 site-specific DNA-adenine methylase [Pseudoroseicyclus aestuarii]
MQTDMFTLCSTVEPVAPWLGGKRNLARRLVSMIDQIPHTLYAEPFIGMGGIFLRRRSRPRAEVINDISRDIATLFRILQRHYPQFLEVLRFQLTTRAEFERLTRVDPTTLTDLERAARFLYLQRTAFGGKATGRSFGIAREQPARFNLTTLEPMLEDVHARLSGVLIECLPWAELLERYDGEGALFYLDPPYWGGEDDYGKAIFARDDFAKIAEALRGLKGRFILSINDVPEIREVFAGFEMEAVQTTYTIAKGEAQTERAELIIHG